MKCSLGFMSGKGTVDAIFIVRQMLENYKMAGRKLHMVGCFIVQQMWENYKMARRKLHMVVWKQCLNMTQVK